MHPTRKISLIPIGSTLKCFQPIFIHLPPFDGLSSENSACHNDSQPCFLAGDLTGDAFAGELESKCRWSDRIDFDGDLDRWRALLGEPERESCCVLATLRIWKVSLDVSGSEEPLSYLIALRLGVDLR